MIDPQRREKLEKLLHEIGEVLYGVFFDPEVYERLKELARQVNQECGVLIKETTISIDQDEKEIKVDFLLKEISPDDKSGAPNQNITLTKLKVTEGDLEFARDMRVKLDDEDAAEIQGVYAGETAPDASVPADDSAGDPDARSIEEIVGTLETLSYGLNQDSRKTLADTFNNDSALKQLGVRFSDDEKLQDNTVWFAKIHEIIDKIQEIAKSDEMLKRPLLALENLFKIALESQEN